MNVKHEQFIGIYENAFTKEYCNSVINYFEKIAEAGYTVNRQEVDKSPKSMKEDTYFFCSAEAHLDSSLNLQKQFNQTLWDICYPDYVNKFWSLKDFDPHNSYHFKIQKTEPGQGYHVWHCESDDRKSASRILVWSLYLNDVIEGGETEFIFQQLRIKPKAGTLLIWPAGFTHTHRGNPPLSGTKYIVTGWIEF
jgi:hypothetical protein